MKFILKMFFSIGIIIIILGVIFFLIIDEKFMYNFITVIIIGIISIGAVFLIYAKDLKSINPDKSKHLYRFVFTWILSGLFIIPIVLVVVKALLNYI